ncbi:M15 family metallopeptidase [Xylanimonas oleitrophica]|uniref:M15 family metallopeptidase n=1 Tax=Xylanimonas oleitrophica TaxID=2607479 RepID=UPI0011B3E977|nr:M15 family metallopeptidase [Xylanimonas oleitrophica]
MTAAAAITLTATSNGLPTAGPQIAPSGERPDDATSALPLLAGGAGAHRGAAASRSQERPELPARTTPPPPAERTQPAPEETGDAQVLDAEVLAAQEAAAPVPAPEPAPEEAPAEEPGFPALPGCDGEITGTGSNGRIAAGDLCDIWQRPFKVRADAAASLSALNDAYTAEFGEPLCLTGGYRSYEQQVALKKEKPSLAATPGRSNHGWGLAVDICDYSYAGKRWDWLKLHGPEYGWDNPAWARRGGDGPYEPWHWEYTEGVAALSAAGRG